MMAALLLASHAFLVRPVVRLPTRRSAPARSVGDAATWAPQWLMLPSPERPAGAQLSASGSQRLESRSRSGPAHDAILAPPERAAPSLGARLACAAASITPYVAGAVAFATAHMQGEWSSLPDSDGKTRRCGPESFGLPKAGGARIEDTHDGKLRWVPQS